MQHINLILCLSKKRRNSKQKGYPLNGLLIQNDVKHKDVLLITIAEYSKKNFPWKKTGTEINVLSWFLILLN